MGEHLQHSGWGGNPQGCIKTEKKNINLKKKIFSHFLTKMVKKCPILKVNGRETKRLGHDVRNMSEKMW